MLDRTADAVRSVDAKTVKRWLDRHEILLVDVREAAEFEAEHIPGALLLPLSSFDAESFPVLPGRRIVLHCAIGKRSEAAGKMLLREGHLEVMHMAGGLRAWKEAGLPLEEAPEPPPAPAEAAPAFLCPAPGRVLADDYLGPLGISPARLAGRIGLDGGTLAGLIAGEVAVDAEMSLRLARYFSTEAGFWMRLQLEHDLEQARHRLGERIRREIRPHVSGG